ncbi:hypothetical protein LSAT2_015690, partial [Lamellibrachia satsuma]
GNTPHFITAQTTLLKSYTTVQAHFENTVESSGGTADVLGCAKNILKRLKDYSTMAWIHTVLDILTVPGQLRLVFQRDETTVNDAVETLSTANLSLVALTLCPGKN